jgi:cytochrome P450
MRVHQTDYDSARAGFCLGGRFEVFGPLLGDGIFTQDGDSWKHSREMLRPLFSGNRIDNFLQIQEHVEALIASIPEGKVVDFQPLFFRFTLDTSTYLLFGRNINTLGTPTPLSEAFAESFRVAQDFLAQRGRVGSFYWIIGGKKFRRACATVHEFVDDAIQKALGDLEQVSTSERASKYGFLGTLLQETQDPEALRDQLLNLLLAGRDTTACCLTWAM